MTPAPDDLMSRAAQLLAKLEQNHEWKDLEFGPGFFRNIALKPADMKTILAALRHLVDCRRPDALRKPRAGARAAEREKLARVVGAARATHDAMAALISESGGVYGLHLNGDVAPWEELLLGGRFEEWLAPINGLAEALAALDEKELGNDA